jgi:precorrin-6x reductase
LFLRNEKARQEYFQLQRTEGVDCSHPFTISPSKTVALPSPEATLPTFDLKAYARRGAEARIAELAAELNEIEQAKRQLRRESARSPSKAATDDPISETG